MAAIAAARAGLSVLVLDRSPVPGARLCLAGMGRGAVSNRELSVEGFYGKHARFVTDALDALPPEKLRTWCSGLGVELEEARWTGILSPTQGGAALVLALVDALREAGGELVTRSKVTAVQPRKRSLLVTLQNGDRLKVSRLVLATGGCHLPQLGGTRAPDATADAPPATGRARKPASQGLGGGSGYRIAKSLGHRIEPPFPAQVGLRVSEAWPYRLPGLWMDVELRLYVSGRERSRAQGAMLFTQSGLTGEAVFAISREVGPALAEGENPELAVNFFPDLGRDEVATWMFRAFGERVQQRVSDALDTLVPRVLGDELLELARINPRWRVERLNEIERGRLHRHLVGSRLTVTNTLGFRAAESTRGGVHVREVDPRTFRSRVQPGLYVVGGILDVDGRWGGFDQHFALAAGYLAGEALAAEKGAIALDAPQRGG